MNQFWEKVEHTNEKLIPYAVVILAIVIIYEIFFHTDHELLNQIVEIVDFCVILVFVIDLIFLAIRAKSTTFFFKNYWLDILAVLPLGFLFRGIGLLFEGLSATREIILSQELLHEGLEARKEIALVARGERIAEVATKAGREVRIATRIARVISKTRLFKYFMGKDSQAHHNTRRGISTRDPKRQWTRSLKPVLIPRRG